MADVQSPAATRSPFDYASIVLVTAAGLMLVGGLVFVLAASDVTGEGGAKLFRSLAALASPVVAALTLAGVAIVTHGRHAGRETSVVAGRAALTVGSLDAVVAMLLLLNGLLLDVTDDRRGVTALIKLGNATGRLGTITLVGFALWLAITAPPARRKAAMAPPTPEPTGESESPS